MLRSGGGQSPAYLLASFALGHSRGWWKRTEGKIAHDVLSGNCKLVTSQLSGSIPTNLPSFRLQNSVFNPDPDVSKGWTVLKMGK